MESTDSREFHPTFRNSGVRTLAAGPRFSGTVGFQALNDNFMFVDYYGRFHTVIRAITSAFSSTLCRVVFPYCHCVDISIFSLTVFTLPCYAGVDG